MSPGRQREIIIGNVIIHNINSPTACDDEKESKVTEMSIIDGKTQEDGAGVKENYICDVISP